MLSKKNRLTKKKDFEAVFKNSKTFKQGFLVLKTAKNNLGINRFGFVVSLKVSKKAVVRNRVKRRLRETVKLEIKNNNKKEGIDAIFISLPEIERKSFSEIKEGAIKLLKKSGIT